MSNDSFCSICGWSEKTVLHAVRDCQVAKAIWLQHCDAVEVAAAGLAYSRSVVAATQLGKHRSGQYFIRVQLHPPLHEWYKPNTDGAVKQRIGRAYAGGLIKAIGFQVKKKMRWIGLLPF
ncbi:hypothetical protein GOBAR_AA38337 [Gossypium barbadense]|uniref:Reverse transcriptase zinc-binding domain-containing protein n=1 Tax=Gossypium barbadense TaxID=3634 RepID=A0A2P5VU59_GOSBA|nr:hypothetical protein GOBAR_AA38337 [Gossypium barbadense]